MLRASLLANAEILPQARQGSYFFNRIGRFLPSATNLLLAQLRKIGDLQFFRGVVLLTMFAVADPLCMVDAGMA